MDMPEIDLTGLCPHCGAADSEHFAGCIMGPLGYIALDEDETGDFVDEVRDREGRI